MRTTLSVDPESVAKIAVYQRFDEFKGQPVTLCSKKIFFSVRLCCIFKIDQRGVSNDSKDTNNQSDKQILCAFFYFIKVELNVEN
jgi:hypothetical protein